mmetsp:Transcript_33855/g.107519  ORF Transcript_33855/g.107519 Transcript_33855/m.107519 type:complete len:273 (-) Transcript_33855:373-1191(-)
MRQFLLHRPLGRLDETWLIKGHLCGAQLLRHESVDDSHTAVLGLLPGLEKELPGQPRIRGLHLQLQHVHHPHQQGHAVVPAPVLQLRLLALHLVEEVLQRAAALLAPGLQVQVKLRQPGPQALGVLEGASLLPLLQRAALEQVALDLRPLQPAPRVHVLQRPGALLARRLELQRVEVEAGEAAADDLHRVQAVHGEEAREAPGGLHLHGGVHEVLALHAHGAALAGVVPRRGAAWPDREGGSYDAVHLLGHGPLAHLSQVRFQWHLRSGQLL